MNSLVLLLGSNLGERILLLERAREKISREIGRIEKYSSLYETAPWGYRSEHAFINQCLEVMTPHPPRKCLDLSLAIESQLGRTRGKMADRLMDIDILFYEDLVIEESGLMIPHPRLSERRFTLEPLAEILPDKHHPVLGSTVVELLQRCTDKLPVKRLK